MDELLSSVTQAIRLGRRVQLQISVSIDGRVEHQSKVLSPMELRAAADKEPASPPTPAEPSRSRGLLNSFIERGVGLTNLEDENPSALAGETAPAPTQVLERLIADLGLSLRSLNCLKRADVRTIGDLIRYSELDLGMVKNFGTKCLDEIKEKLRELGLALRLPTSD